MNRISYEQRLETYTKALAHYGEENQLTVALEELSECQKEICKFLRGYGNAGHLAEEVADAMIMLEQVVHIFGLDEMVGQEMDRKVKRLEGRIKGGSA
jgi:NTP pyrophosphatase (non-canonical NTP hydrolase)